VFGKLYIVATPIGNREDITDRAKRILGEADIVAAEDTRTTQKLFNMLGVRNKMVSNHRFNENGQSDFLISELCQGKNVAIVSDAGTPCISDPGQVIVRSAAERGIEVIGVCGASAVITALSVSGFNFTSFAFHGFLPRENKAIRELLQRAGNSDIPVSVFFESPKRMEKTLRLIGEELPDSEICLCNDLTKLHERIYRGTPQAVLDELESNPSAGKGEYTLVIHIISRLPRIVSGVIESREALLIDYIVNNGGSIKDAIGALQEKNRGRISKKELFAAALNLKDIMSRLIPADADGTGGFFDNYQR
jgi:16S rRNA (cytidine1402-2'-O)-methyltransferase